MRKTIITIILGIALISLASATTIYSGSCLEVDLSELESLDNVVYDVVGNSSNLEGLTIELNGTIANICTVPNFKPDSFTILFIDDSTKEVIKEVHHYSSGGSRTKYIDRNITIENKTIEYVNVTTPCDNQIDNSTTTIITTPPEKEDSNLVYYFYGLLIAFVIIFIKYLILEKQKSKVKEKEENKNERRLKNDINKI